MIRTQIAKGVSSTAANAHASRTIRTPRRHRPPARRCREIMSRLFGRLAEVPPPLFGCGRKLRVLWSATSNVIPRCLGIHKNMHVNLNSRVTVDGTESYPMHLIFMSSAYRGSTGATETQAPSRQRLIVRKVFGTADP